MNGFIVGCENRPGEVARASEAIAAKGVNITGVAGLGFDERGAIAVVTSDEPKTRTALQDAAIDYRECEVVTLAVPHQPGSLAEASRRLADAGVNIEFVAASALRGDEVTLTVGVGDGAAARQALGALVAE